MPSPVTNADLEPALRAWTGIDGLRTALGDWPDSGGDSELCNTPDWILAHAESFDPAAIFGWSAEADGRTVAVLPFRVEPARGRFALRRAIHSADGTFDSDYLDLCVVPGFETSVVRGLVDALAATRHIDAVVLAGVPSDSIALRALRDELIARNLPRRERDGDCLAAPLGESFDEYLAGLGKRMRSKVRQSVRQATEQEATLVWCDDASEISRHLAGLFELHAARWESAGEAGSFADGARRAFYERLARVHLERGELRFARLDRGGQTLAYQIGVRRGATYYQLQEGFQPDEESFRPATALRALAIGQLIDEGVRSYDFMAGATRHKRDWGGIERECTTLAFALPRWRARIAYGARAWLDARRR